MVDSIDSVNDIISSLDSWAQHSKDPIPGICRAHIATLEAVKTELRQLREATAPLSPRLGDLSDIPADLKAELSGIEIDEFESQLVTVINSYGGLADLNQVLVGLFRKFTMVQTRRFVQQKLWRMTTDGLVWSVPKRKGVYTTKNPSDVSSAAAVEPPRGFFTIKKPPKVAKSDDDEIPL